MNNKDNQIPIFNRPTGLGTEVLRFHTMVKPSGSQCNLDCSYCFYLHKENLLEQPKRPRMSDEVLEAHVRQYIEAQTGAEVVFSWQGGEPTLMGLPFFKRIIELQKKYCQEGQKIENDLQTNGVLLDEEWCAFLKENNFLVGISIDGPATFHDKHRVSKTGHKTHDRVMRAVALLHQYQIPFSVLCVVNRDNARRPIDVYRFLRDEVKAQQIQFIPGVEKNNFTSEAPGFWDNHELPIVSTAGAKPGRVNSIVTEWSVEAEDWGYFLNRVWDEWFKKDVGSVFIDQFENVISMMFGNGSQKCVTAKICGKALALEHNGDVYSCDHFVYPEYKLGNIISEHEGNLAFSEKQQRFSLNKFDSLPTYCQSCIYLNLCWGHCPKDRFIKTPDGEPGLNYLCEGLRMFYKKALSHRKLLEDKLKPLQASY
jgi:uncharacterized protein